MQFLVVESGTPVNRLVSPLNLQHGVIKKCDVEAVGSSANHIIRAGGTDQ